ncbi:UNVERIFIED_CONTAM: Bet1-like protein [Sesamum calycinum]|uniref:Bet1-like protein n=1 Tax=Sesamum calycinum TaxID=2727403 RepID=A0AAW2MCD9_9LAMI
MNMEDNKDMQEIIKVHINRKLIEPSLYLYSIDFLRPNMVTFNKVNAATREAPLVLPLSEDEISTRRTLDTREGLSTRSAAYGGYSDEVQVRIDPDFDDEVTGLRKQVRRLRDVAQEIETEAKFQNDFLNQLQMTLIKAQAGMKNNMRRLNKSIIREGSSHVMHSHGEKSSVVVTVSYFEGSQTNSPSSRGVNESSSSRARPFLVSSSSSSIVGVRARARARARRAYTDRARARTRDLCNKLELELELDVTSSSSSSSCRAVELELELPTVRRRNNGKTGQSTSRR